MNCPICAEDTVVLFKHGADRRRRCTNGKCNYKFTTTEMLKDESERQAEAVRAVIEVAEKLKPAA